MTPHHGFVLTDLVLYPIYSLISALALQGSLTAQNVLVVDAHDLAHVNSARLVTREFVSWG